ncbi:MAG TPA: hypothetical protein VFG52_06250 [Xanthomonadales bacterium]|nr:hypothetical protein [Xanthomonadales bacterium]
MSLFKLLRIVILLSVLFVIVVGTWMTERKLARWDQPIWVTLYPIVDEDNAASTRFAQSLELENFSAINDFLTAELSRYSVAMVEPLKFQLAPVSSEKPPAIPERHSPIAIAWWSLQMRWWAWRREKVGDLIAPDIQIFLIYHQPGEYSEMQMSVGMRKGRYGLVKAYTGAQNRSHNHIVITHELLHVLGASDKYAFGTGDPIFPEGYAEPNKVPLFPQNKAEIMAGVIPLSANQHYLPKSLEQCRIGQVTAEEIGLFQKLVDN